MTGRQPSPAPAAEELETLRGPLTAYCYRMLGAAADTDDAVQETMLRALRHLDRFDPDRARLTTWVHRIATNVCLDMLRAARRRVLVPDVPPDTPASGELGIPLPPGQWVEPMPEGRLDLGVDPAEQAVRRETVRLALVAALQWLPPRQRAVLVLRDVLAFTAQETAAILETTAPAVTSALQRARATLADHRPEQADVLDPADTDQQRLIQDYVEAFESHDIARLAELLRTDARSSMPPFAWLVRGRENIAALIAGSDACADDRLLPIAVNGSPGFGQYRPDDQGVHRPFALIALELRDGRVAHIVTFLGTGDRFGEFGLPALLEPAPA